jgi:hypothetical protein
MLLAGAGHGQQAPTAVPDQPAPQPKIAPQTDPDRPGLIDAVGHWIGDSVTNWNSGLKGAADVAKDAAGAAGDAAKGAANVATERVTCPVAPNGAPDCRSAADTICKAHGFASGTSIDFQTAEKCPPIALNRPDGEPPRCVIESYVTRALCR